MVSEFGADAKAGLHGDALTRFSEEYQADVYRRQLAMLKRIPNLRIDDVENADWRPTFVLRGLKTLPASW